MTTENVNTNNEQTETVKDGIKDASFLEKNIDLVISVIKQAKVRERALEGIDLKSYLRTFDVINHLDEMAVELPNRQLATKYEVPTFLNRVYNIPVRVNMVAGGSRDFEDLLVRPDFSDVKVLDALSFNKISDDIVFGLRLRDQQVAPVPRVAYDITDWNRFIYTSGGYYTASLGSEVLLAPITVRGDFGIRLSKLRSEDEMLSDWVISFRKVVKEAKGAKAQDAQ